MGAEHSTRRAGTWRTCVLVALGVALVGVGCVPQPDGPGQPNGTPLPGGGGYARVLRVDHGGDRNGNLLVSVTLNSRTQQVLESTDDGASFTPIGQIVRDDTVGIHGTGIVELDDGTLLLSLALRFSGDFDAPGFPPWNYDQRTFRMDDAIYRSTDGGRNWDYLSSCARTDLPGTYGGIWEPDLYVDDRGDLNCIWSDETSQPRHSQTLERAISTDGGATWGPPESVVRLPQSTERPGMATTARLGDGTWIMSYEICGAPDACLAHVRFSDDGRDWGTPAERGRPVVAADGARMVAAPVVAWTPAGGPEGTVVLTSNRVERPLVAPEGTSGSTMAINRAGGRGSWELVRSPLQAPQNATCRSFSSPVFPLDTTGRLLEIKRGLDADGRCGLLVATGRIPG